MEEKTPRGKADSSEIEKRVNTVYLMLLQGFQRKSVIQYCAKSIEDGGFGVGERQADEYLAKAREVIKSNISDDTSHKRNEILTQYYDLYQKNYKNEDYKECRAVLSEIKAVFGIDAAQKIEVKDTTVQIGYGNKDEV